MAQGYYPRPPSLGEAGHRRPWVISTVHSSRVRSLEDLIEREGAETIGAFFAEPIMV